MRFIDKDKNSDLVKNAQSVLNSSRHYNESNIVREIIRNLYSSCCCYCECSPEDGSFFQIEHFYPKNSSRYKRFKKSIENLHYSCQRCNNLKGRKPHNNILSPNYYLTKTLQWQITNSQKIEREIFYIGHLLYSSNQVHKSTDRGKQTILLFDLNNQNNDRRGNRKFLVESRLRSFSRVYNILDAIYELVLNYSHQNNNAIKILIIEVIKYTNRDSQYSTMVIHNFGNDIVGLIRIYLYRRYGRVI